MTVAALPVRLPRSQTKDAGRVLARAFHDDPFWCWILPDESRRARVLPWFMGVWARYCNRHGEVYASGDKIEGVAVWLPPGKFPPSQAGTMLAGMILVPLRFGLAKHRLFTKASEYMDRLHARDVPGPHWFLATLGVDPPRQSQGLGSALLQPALTQADRDGLPAYLETQSEKNVAFYQRHGFDVVKEIDLPGGGPHIWTMKREPAG